MWILKNKNIFLVIAFVLVSASAIMLIVQSVRNEFKASIEFTGGTLVEYTFNERPTVLVVTETIDPILSGVPRVQAFGEQGIAIRTSAIDQSTVDAMTTVLKNIDSQVVLSQSSTIGPSLGNELTKKAVIALLITVILIILFIAFAFRRVSKPIASWKYGVIVVGTLLHDVIIPFGIVILLGREFDTLMVVGLLSILGLSVNDTIVVFDRIRENLQLAHNNKETHHFDTIVGTSLTQTIRRSLITSTSIILVTGILAFFGPEATRTLALILALGTIFGTYSSIFVASPLLVLWEKYSRA